MLKIPNALDVCLLVILRERNENRLCRYQVAGERRDKGSGIAVQPPAKHGTSGQNGSSGAGFSRLVQSTGSC